MVLLIVTTLHVIGGEVHQVIRPVARQRLGLLLTNDIHILLRSIYQFDIAESAIGLVESVHGVDSLVHFVAVRVLGELLRWNKLHQSLCSHCSIHLVQLADGAGGHGHGRLEAYVAAELLRTQRAVVCVGHAPIVSRFLGGASGEILFVVPKLTMRWILSWSWSIRHTVTRPSGLQVSYHPDTTAILECAHHVVATDAIGRTVLARAWCVAHCLISWSKSLLAGGPLGCPRVAHS